MWTDVPTFDNDIIDFIVAIIFDRWNMGVAYFPASYVK